MLNRTLVAALAASALAPPALARQDEAIERVDLRVIGTRPNGLLVIDRGQRDGAEVGDIVFLTPREGGTYSARVTRVEDRSAWVELTDKSLELRTGTRGEIYIPRSRRAAPEPPPTPTAGEGETEQPTEPPKWSATDDEWKPGMPLLAQVDVLRPDQREKSMTGRVYGSGDVVWPDADGVSDVFLRGGLDATFENFWGRGGILHVDGELSQRKAEEPGPGDESNTFLRIHRLSYELGGNRFEQDRIEFGRFLQDVMPEFGVLDGVEWSRRIRGGDRFGASIGYLPEPDEDFQGGHDLQLSAYYQWVADENERLSATVGYQKSFHHSNSDRDLFIGKVRYLPIDGWTMLGTAWIDYYTAGDDPKDEGPELTHFSGTATRQLDDVTGVEVSIAHLRFPQIDRREFAPLLDAQYENDHDTRLSLRGWRDLTSERRGHAEVGYWFDEGQTGGDLELGLDIENLHGEGSRTGGDVFWTIGQFVNVVGARVRYGRSLRNGRWDVSYELANHDNDGFLADNDDILQHRVRANRELTTASGWSVSAYLEGLALDDDKALIAGFYLQHSF